MSTASSHSPSPAGSQGSQGEVTLQKTGRASPGVARPGIALAVIVGCQLMIALDTSVVTVALPGIKETLGLSTGGLAWIQNAYLLAFGGLLLLGGRIGDLAGRRRVFTAGIGVFTLASLLGGLAGNGGLLIGARALQGLAAAFAAPSAMALIVTNFAGPARVRALSLYSAVAGAGAAVGMLAGGILTGLASWRLAFFVNVPVGLVLLVLAPRFLAGTPPHRGRFDLAGAATSTLGMTALVYGFVRAGEDGWRDALTLGAFGASLVLLALFVTIEARARQPILPLGLLRARARSGAYLTLLLTVAGMFGAFFFLTQYLQHGLGYGALHAGLAFLPLVGAQFVVVRLAPRILRRLGNRTAVILGIAVLGLGLLWLSRLPEHGGYAVDLLGPFLLMGAGAGLSVVPLNLTILAAVAQGESGAASGVAQTMIYCGGALGSAVLVTVYGATSDHGMNAVFATGAALAGSALLTFLLFRGRVSG